MSEFGLQIANQVGGNIIDTNNGYHVIQRGFGTTTPFGSYVSQEPNYRIYFPGQDEIPLIMVRPVQAYPQRFYLIECTKTYFRTATNVRDTNTTFEYVILSRKARYASAAGFGLETYNNSGALSFSSLGSFMIVDSVTNISSFSPQSNDYSQAAGSIYVDMHYPTPRYGNRFIYLNICSIVSYNILSSRAHVGRLEVSRTGENSFRYTKSSSSRSRPSNIPIGWFKINFTSTFTGYLK